MRPLVTGIIFALLFTLTAVTVSNLILSILLCIGLFCGGIYQVFILEILKYNNENVKNNKYNKIIYYNIKKGSIHDLSINFIFLVAYLVTILSGRIPAFCFGLLIYSVLFNLYNLYKLYVFKKDLINTVEKERELYTEQINIISNENK